MDTEQLRLAVYRSFATTGRPPSRSELAETTGLPIAAVDAGLQALHEEHHLALDPSGERILMAHPFASIPLGFSVMGRRTLWWGGCAWDSFALPHLLPDDPQVLVATNCPGCGAALAWTVTNQAPPPGDQVAHFLTPVARMWDDVVRTCGHQRIFCNEQCVDTWRSRTGEPLGYVMDLTTLWRLASGWYDGRLDQGYVRREPKTAAAYFAQAGLTGPFWGLPG
ncbi:alkylmercury lyase family protein [Actinoallomurus sp. NBC_01490]|uniref:organomercurial lyase n=1 Tax=Actinoallomurus sp. NBC_01490 TaxID=2903557 RepID=UPI002E2F0AA5|nr:organomercurial lyase [Actinoallomurus sp. NBC_01490]